MSDLDWLPGPAFLSWFRMGNLQKWAGPPSDFWISSQLNLAQRIINRMVDDFGMNPVVPAFSGFLPDEFSTLYPDAEVQKLTSWSGFNCTNSCITWLEPSDPLFKQFQQNLDIFSGEPCILLMLSFVYLGEFEMKFFGSRKSFI